MKLFAADALTPDGWRRDVLIDVDPNGTIAKVESNANPADADTIVGPLIPGMPNLHSHAFQRAIAGRTGRRAAGEDSFWTWRREMYGFLDHVDADAFEAIAAEAYVEMLKAGYTSVAEFHYVHHDPFGNAYADPAELARRVLGAAASAGIAITLLPVFYAHSAFGGARPSPAQRRFIHSLDSYARVVERLRNELAHTESLVGVAAHSLRAVTPEELAHVIDLAPRAGPIHIHAAEQVKEVDDCIAWSGKRPIEWLVDHAALDSRWCVVHATHMTESETWRLAESGAVAGLAPSTEADLGDGTFSARDFVDAGGTFGIGSDSNTVIDPFAELRQLEYSQRLLRKARNVVGGAHAPVGETLYSTAARGGAQALARKTGAIAAGNRADLLVLNVADPALVSQPIDVMLDAAIFGPCRAPVRDVMVSGRWVVRQGHHEAEEAVLARYAATLRSIRTLSP